MMDWSEFWTIIAQSLIGVFVGSIALAVIVGAVRSIQSGKDK